MTDKTTKINIRAEKFFRNELKFNYVNNISKHKIMIDYLGIDKTKIIKK